jgi:O-antigen/teichoic acid export membrane protein
VGGLALYSPAFIARWMGPKFELSHVVVFIIAVPYALRFMQYAAHSLLYALGLQQQLMWVRCIGGVVAGVLAIVGGYCWGVVGVATGCAIEMGVSYAIVIPIMVARCLGISPWRYFFLDVLLPGVKGAMLPVLAALAVWAWVLPDYVMLVRCFAVYGLVFVITSPFTMLDAEGRLLLRRALGR